VKDGPKQEQPRIVPKLARTFVERSEPAGIGSKASVGTDRMLEALETGVRGRKCHSLYDKVVRRGYAHIR